MCEEFRIRIIIFLSMSFIASLSSISFGRLITVDDDGPADFNNIQAAIDDANHTDTIVVKDGAYTGFGNRDIEFKRKAVTIRSQNGPALTIIDCENKGYGFHIIDNSAGQALLEGFTIRNASLGAIKCYSSILPRVAPADSFKKSHTKISYTRLAFAPVIISNCKIIENPDGGILLDGHTNVTINNCYIAKNRTAGVWSYMSFPNFRNCAIVENDGTGIRATGATITNCTVTANSGIGIWAYNLIITNSIVWANLQGQIYAPDDTAAVSYSDIQNGFSGTCNIDVDPLFVIARSDYHLQADSPCIDAGDPNFIAEPNESDLDGKKRVANNIIDIGAYEYQRTRIIYADDDATGANSGSSWNDAYRYLQDALADADSAEKPVEICVAQGTYTPLGSFILKNGVAILGGYAGFGAPDPNSRDIEGFETVLSGKVDHIVWSENTNGSAIIDGFTITGGQGAGIPRNGGDCCGGGGIYNKGGSPTILNCTITANAGSLRGGGMANVDGSSPTLINCTFERNYSLYHGGGIYSKNSSLTLINCRFINNVSDNGHGGGIYARETSLVLGYCSFIDNKAERDGGAIAIERAHPSATIQNCVFTSNTADIGGGIATEWMGSVLVENCIFAGNIAWRGGAIVGGRLTNCTLTGNKARCLSAAETATLNNCIVWGNLEGDPDECFWFVGGFYSCFDNPAHGNAGGSIFVDPCFANIGYWDPNGTPEDPNNDFWVNGDYHLKSQAGRWEPKTQSWVKDDVTSPCIDAGDPMSPIGYEPFPNGGRINMGAYGGTAEASKSYFGKPICETIIAGDINGDCKVNFADFYLLAIHWLEDNTPQLQTGW